MAKVEGAKKEAGRVGSRFVTPEQACNSSSLQNVLGYFQDYIPQPYSTNSSKTDIVLWARFETADCNDITMDYDQSELTSLPLLLFVGLSTGCTLWLVQPNSDAREVYSAVNDGEGFTKVAVLLKSPDASLGEDKFKQYRPLLAVVRKGSGGYKPSYNTLLIMSLRDSTTSTASTTEVKRIEFERNSIIDVKCNRRVIVIILQKRLLLLDAASLEKKWIIKTGYQPTDTWTNPIALSTRWIAIADLKIHPQHLSIGGISTGASPPVVSTVMNTVKKGFAALSDTLSGLTGNTTNVTAQSTEAFPLVVTILDLLYPHSGEVNVGEITNGVIAHFLAYTGSSAHITVLKFNNSGNLLFTADSEGQIFNIFQVSPSILGSPDCKVNHLYSLYRGSTTGIVQDVCFSNDSRWVAVSTLNGTTHLFPISSYGGPATVRTHTHSRVVNQLSRFHTSAGIHPAKETTNRHFPITISPLQQIKQPYSSGYSNNKGTNTVSDDVTDNVCVRTIFADFCDSNSGRNKIDFSDSKVDYSFYIFGGSGLLTEHLLEPLRSVSSKNSSTLALVDDEESSIELNCSPRLIWKLLSKPLEEPIPLPLDKDNPLILANDEYQEHITSLTSSNSMSGNEGVWLSQVELLTYAPPTRRLWMGPQFNFKTVSLPSEKGTEDELASPTAVLPPFHNVSEYIGSSDLSLNSIPVSTGLRKKDDDWRGGADDAGVEVFGSWNDVAPRLKTEVNLEEQILDAMSDTYDQTSYTVISGNSSLTHTSFT